MCAAEPKKLLILYILEVLKRHSDSDHRLTQREIMQLVERDFDTSIDRKSIKRNLDLLIDAGYDIGFSTTPRQQRLRNGREEEFEIKSDFYFEHELTDAELRLIIDGLIFSRHISLAQRRQLVKKLEGLSSKHFSSRMTHVYSMKQEQTDNKQLFLNIELLDEAITKRRKVTFKYTTFGTDKKPHPRKRPDGSDRIYLCTPYQMAAKEDKYYLICNNDWFSDISNYRVDRIIDLAITDEPAKPFSELKNSEGDKLNLATYMQQHIYMYSSENVACTFRIMKRMVADIMDMFGSDIVLSHETDQTIDVAARVNELSMKEFAKRYAPDVVVIAPASLAERVRNELKAAYLAYEPDSFIMCQK